MKINMKELICLCILMTVSLNVLPQTNKNSDGEKETNFKNFRTKSVFKKEIDFSNIDYQLIYEVIFHLTNEIRAKNNLNILEYAEELEKSAEMHANDMVKGNFFSHFNESNPKRNTPNDRARLCGISNPYLSENIIEGYGLQYKPLTDVYVRGKGKFSKTPNGELIKPHSYLSFCETQITGWMNSKEHKANILSKNAKQFGCGASFFLKKDFNEMPTLYVVQNFQSYQLIKNERIQ